MSDQPTRVKKHDDTIRIKKMPDYSKEPLFIRQLADARKTLEEWGLIEPIDNKGIK
jgi:hypothetical protein